MQKFVQIDFKSLPTSVVMIVTTTLSLLLTYKLFCYIKYRIAMSKIPGPKEYPFIGHLFSVLVSPDKLFNKLTEYSKKFYPTYRLCTGIKDAVFISSPIDAETILSGMKHIDKNLMYKPLENWLQEGLLLSTGPKWQYRRKVLTPTFHFNILQEFTDVFIDEGKKLVQDLTLNANKVIDVVPIVTQFTLQTICETAMGTTLAKSGDTYRDSVYKMGELTVHRIVRPWYYSPLIYIFSRQFWESWITTNYLHKFTMKVIKDRETTFNPSDITTTKDGFQLNTKKKMAMLDLLLSAKRSGSAINDKGIQEEVDTFMFEGHDTTATSISFTFMLLANNKDVQQKIFEELYDIFGDDSDRDITMNDLSQMKYLERVIKESLRLYPSVPMIGRCTSEDMVTSTGCKIPKDVIVMVRIYDIHRNPEIYPDPEKFDPDRFLPENSKGRHPFAYIPFSAGPRNCIGQKFAMLELKTAVASVMRHFQLEPVDTPDTITLQTDIIIRTTHGLKMKFIPRKL
nr:cytochrome P450 4C1-like [Onthophagus taurus]